MAIAPITGMLKKRFFLDLTVGMSLGGAAGYYFWFQREAKEASRVTKLREIRLSQGLPVSETTPRLLAAHSPKQPAFVFDIDGVLIQGGRVLPEARRALALVHGANPRRVTIPHLYLTNGGGVTEAAKAADLQAKLGVPVRPDQVVLSHSPMRALAAQYANRWVLAVGGRGPNGMHVLKEYGFRNVCTPYQIVNWNRSVAPFCVAGPDALAAHQPPQDFSDMDIAAVLVLHDSRDLGTDLQVMVDVLRSPRGNLGLAFPPASPNNNARPHLDPKLLAAMHVQHTPIYFSNPDFLWANEYPVARFGQRALRVALEAVWKELTGSDLQSTTYGKPETATYAWAYRELHQMIHSVPAADHHRLDAKSIANCVNDHFEVYAVGDNPAADIQGAHHHGWHSFLVRTGVYQPGDELPAPPTEIVETVEDAVHAVYDRHYGGASLT
ncbi:HAD-like domain-containing protein [Blastocladiella britannica]|nr:HAD-like domain-containing protein [Blastocladiella britannica]